MALIAAPSAGIEEEPGILGQSMERLAGTGRIHVFPAKLEGVP